MARIKGATNKQKLPNELAMPEEQRVDLVADLILEIILGEESDVAAR